MELARVIREQLSRLPITTHDNKTIVYRYKMLENSCSVTATKSTLFITKQISYNNKWCKLKKFCSFAPC